MSPEQEQRAAEIRAEIEARWNDPEFEKAAMAFASEQLRRTNPYQRRGAPTWADVGKAFLCVAVVIGIAIPLALWIDKKARDLHPGMHWVPQVDGHWEKDKP